MATITIPASGAVQIRIHYTMEHITDGTAYGKTKVTITGMDAANATGLSVGTGNPAFGVKLRLISTDTWTDSLYEFSGTAGTVPSVPLSSGFSAFPGLSSASITVTRTARNENFQFLITKYAGFGGGGFNPCFLYGSPSNPLYIGNRSDAPWGSSEIAFPDAVTASTLSVGNGTIGSALVITINRSNSALTHTLTYAFAGATGTIVTKTTGTAVSWTPAMSLCGKIPNAASGSCTLTCDTYSGSTKIGSTTKSITLTCPASVKPSVSDGWASVSYLNTGTAAAGMDCFVQGYSRAQVTLDSTKVTHSYGASTASTKITFGGKDYADTTPVLTASGSQSVTVTVTDTRGRTASQQLSFTVLGYSVPVLSGVEAFRCDFDKNPADDGTYYCAKANVSFSDLGGKNEVTLSARHKVAGGSYGVWKETTPGTAARFDGILTTSTYVVQLKAEDKLHNTSVTSVTIPTATVGMHLRKNHDGVGFGKYCEHENAMELPDGWQILVGSKSVAGRVSLDKASAGAVYDTVSVTSGSWKTVASLTLETGYYYVCDFCVRFATNATGWRGAVVSQVADASTQDGVISNDRRNAVNGSQTFLHVMFFRKGDGVTRYFNAYQNSGGALDAVARVAYIAIPLA